MPRACGALGENGQGVPLAQALGHQTQHAHGVAATLTREEQRARLGDHAPHHRPVGDLGLGDEARRHHGVEGHDVQPGDVVGDHQLGAGAGLPLRDQLDPKHAQHLPRPAHALGVTATLVQPGPDQPGADVAMQHMPDHPAQPPGHARDGQYRPGTPEAWRQRRLWGHQAHASARSWASCATCPATRVRRTRPASSKPVDSKANGVCLP